MAGMMGGGLLHRLEDTGGLPAFHEICLERPDRNFFFPDCLDVGHRTSGGRDRSISEW